MTWCLPEADDETPFGCFEAIRLQEGLSVGSSRSPGREALQIKDLKFVWFRAVVSLLGLQES